MPTKKILNITFFFLYNLLILNAFGDIMSFATYKYNNDEFFISTESPRKQNILSPFVNDFLEKEILNGSIVEIERISCPDGTSSCYQKGQSLIEGKEDIIQYILSHKSRELTIIAVFSYLQYFFVLFAIIFIMIGGIKYIFFKGFKKYGLTLMLLPIAIICFDGLLIYYQMQPVFFSLGFNIFIYLPSLLFFIAVYIFCDIYLSRRK